MSLKTVYCAVLFAISLLTLNAHAAESIGCPNREIIQATQLVAITPVEGEQSELRFGAIGYAYTEESPWVVITGVFDEASALTEGQSLLKKASAPKARHDNGDLICIYYFQSNSKMTRYIVAVPYVGIKHRKTIALHQFV